MVVACPESWLPNSGKSPCISTLWFVLTSLHARQFQIEADYHIITYKHKGKSRKSGYYMSDYVIPTFFSNNEDSQTPLCSITRVAIVQIYQLWASMPIIDIFEQWLKDPLQLAKPSTMIRRFFLFYVIHPLVAYVIEKIAKSS